MMGQSASQLEHPVTPRDKSVDAPTGLSPQKRSIAKRIAFSVALALIVAAVIEFASYVLFGLVEGRPFSYSRTQQHRDQALGLASQSGASTSSGEPAPPEFLRNKSLHPYVGYVTTPQFADEGSAQQSDSLPPHFGYYDGNPLHKRSNDTAIIAIVGGSVAYGFGVPSGGRSGLDALRDRLSSSKQFAGKQIIFVRLAQGGYKQPQQLMTISYLLSLGAEFDAVINLDGFNEVALHPAENAKTGTFPAYPRMWSFQTAGRRREMAVKYQALNYSRRSLAETFSCPVLSRSVAANLVWTLRDRQLKREIYDEQQSLLAETSAEASYESTGPSRVYADEAAMMADLVALWQQSSRQLDRLCRANGTAYYHVLQPNQYVLDSKKLTEQERADAYDEQHPYRRGAETGYPLLVEAGKQLSNEGVHFLDLSHAFDNVDETLYVDTCCHFNATGYDIIAGRITELMLSDSKVRRSENSGEPGKLPSPEKSTTVD